MQQQKIIINDTDQKQYQQNHLKQNRQKCDFKCIIIIRTSKIIIKLKESFMSIAFDVPSQKSSMSESAQTIGQPEVVEIKQKKIYPDSLKKITTNSSFIMPHYESFQTVCQFQIDISFIILLRNPEINQKQQFEKTYIQKMRYCFKDSKLSKQDEINRIYLHLMFSQIENLNKMEILGQDREKIGKISSIFHKTNVMNPQCIYNNLKNDEEVQQIQIIKGNLIFTIVKEVGVNEFKNNQLRISKNYIDFAIIGNGQQDVYFCPFLLRSIPFNAVCRYFAYCPDIEITQKNYGKTFLQIFEERSDEIDFQHWYNENVASIITGNWENSELTKLILSGYRNKYIEKLLIALQGWPGHIDQAIKWLNIYYDGTDWQMRSALRPSIAQVGDNFTINYLIENIPDHRENVMLCLKAPCQNPLYNQQVFSWHRPKLNEYVSEGLKYLWIIVDFECYAKSGFYDWKIFMFRRNGKNEGINKIFNITENKTLQSQIFKAKLHNIRRVQGRIIVQPEKTKQLQIHQIYMECLNQDIFPPKIPSFSDATKEIEKSKELGVNCIYLMGVFERDTGEFGRQGVKCYKRPQASPLALTCRKSPCNMLGGKQKFLALMQESKKHGVKIVTDCTTRVSSSRMHHRYNNLILHYLDDYGRKQIFFGCDGRSINYEDTLNLNYRKKEAWDLLIEEIEEIIDAYKIDGIYLDNGFAWPQIYQINKEQLYRRQTDGLAAYNNDQIFEGEIINKGKDTGYWSSNARSSYPNPFFIALCKKLWIKYPQLLIICQGFENSADQDKALGVIISGPIPRLFKMPKAISQTFGINLSDDGTLNKCTPKQIIHLIKWYQETQKLLPKNSIIIQSTTSHAWPYPAYIFRQATWAFIDLFYFLPEIPMTFIGQQNGRAYRTKAASIFYTNTKSKNVIQNKNSAGDLKRLNSSFFAGPDKIMEPQQVIKGMNSTLRDPAQIKFLQENFRRQVGPQFGYDLAQIHKHYKHRSNLRNSIPLLTSGHMINIGAQHMYGIHTNVLSFAKWNQKEVIIVVINFNNAAIDMHFNLTNLKYLFSNAYTSNLVVRIKNTFDDKVEYEHYIVSELMTAKIETHLEKFSSQIWHLECCKQQNAIELAYRDSMKRIQTRLALQPPRWIHSSILTNQLINIVEKTNNKHYFERGMQQLYERFVKPYDINFNLLISKTHEFWINKNKLSKLFAIFRLIDEAKDNILEDVLQKSIHNLLEGNKLGPIAFVTPEIGKWSSVGGLGIMVDELSKELVKLGEEVYVLTPYYQYNKKGQTNYLEKEGFIYSQNVTAYSAHLSYQFGIHRGKYHNVNYIWFHNPELFSKPYVGEGAQYVTKQLVFFALGVLQTFCSLKIFPSTIVTNDWMCGFVAAYVKNQKYKYVFDGTKFMHICHNLDPLYEGRLYPKFEEGDLNWLIQLPTEQYTEYRNNKLIINPSKCALQNCDNWGTVSNSYKVDLLKDSPLAYVLWKHPNPFAFPNGVRKEQRLHIINTQTPGDHLLSKKKLQEKYFKFDGLNNDLPLFSFIGRVTKQKGVHLIVDSIQDLLHENNFKVQFLIGGPSDSKEQYGKYCASRMKYLTNKYPKCVWSDPDAFFTDGPIVNIGSDFAMMPSMFEPGGIVQHEFFAGHTPVVAFRTGGLKDTVFEYDYKTMKGNGFNFMSFQLEDFKKCMRRAIECYKNKKHYEKIRENAFQSVIEEEDVAKGWNCEFYRLQNKIYVEWDLVERQYNTLKQKEQQGQDQEPDFGKENKGEFYKEEWDTMKGFKEVLIGAARLKGKNHTFTYKTDVIPRPKQVRISGSWDDWASKQKLTFNQLPKNWTITLNLTPNTYSYKYFVDGQWALTKDEQTQTDISNIVNHVVVID